VSKDHVTKRYDVFARSQRGGPLYHIGMVEAFSDDLAKVYAHTTYDEESWFEMCVVPAEQIRWVIEPKALYPREGVNGRGHVVVGQRS
jgi:hypothetical protein